MELVGVLRHIASLIGICLSISRKHCSHPLDFKISQYLQSFALISTGMSLFPLINHYRQGWYQHKYAFMGKCTSILTWVLEIGYALYSLGMLQHTCRNMYKGMYKGIYKYKQNYSYTSTYSAWLAWAIFLWLSCNSLKCPISLYHKELWLIRHNHT